MFQFCGKTCCDEYKKINSVMSTCEYCKTEKIIKETVRFSGIDKSFCSEGKKGPNISRLVMGSSDCAGVGHPGAATPLNLRLLTPDVIAVM